MASNYFSIAAPRVGRNSLMDFSPVGNALDDYGRARERDMERSRLEEAQKYQRGRDAMQDKRQATADERQQAEWIGKQSAAVDRMQPGPQRAAGWQSILARHPNRASLPPEYLDPMKGPALVAAEAGLYRDPREDRLSDIQLRKAEVELANAQRPKAPERLEVNGRIVERGPNGWKEVYAAPEAGDSKLSDNIRKEQNKIDLKTVNEYRQGADNASDVLGALDELEAARDETTKEGPILGFLPNVSGPAQRVQSASENVRLGFVQKTKGAVSDAEMRVFGQATPNMSMRDEAAGPIITGMRLANQRVQERANFFDSWMRSRGSLEGAQEAWKRFTEQKPILERDPKTNKFVPRPENVKAWREFFDGTATATSPANTNMGSASPTTVDPATVPAGTVFEYKGHRLRALGNGEFEKVK